MSARTDVEDGGKSGSTEFVVPRACWGVDRRSVDRKNDKGFTDDRGPFERCNDAAYAIVAAAAAVASNTAENASAIQSMRARSVDMAKASFATREDAISLFV